MVGIDEVFHYGTPKDHRNDQPLMSVLEEGGE